MESEKNKDFLKVEKEEAGLNDIPRILKFNLSRKTLLTENTRDKTIIKSIMLNLWIKQKTTIKINIMKKIEAVIRTSKFEVVMNALHQKGLDHFTYADVKGVGNLQPETGYYRGVKFDAGSIARTLITIVAEADKTDEIVATILHVAQTGEVGDGKIFISDVEKMITIRNGKMTDRSFELA